MKICEQLLLQFLLLTVNISSWVLVSALNSIGLLQSSSRFKEFSLGCLVAGSSLIWKKRKISRDGYSLSFLITRCHSLSFVITRCHSLSLAVLIVVTSCTTHYHSLSLVVPLVVTQRTIHLSFYKRSYLLLHMKIICWRFHIITHLNFWDMRKIFEICARNNRYIQKQSKMLKISLLFKKFTNFTRK